MKRTSLFVLILSFIVSTVSYIPNTHAEEISFELHLPAGWSMVSLPVMPDDASLSALFPDAVVVYRYQKGFGYTRVRQDQELKVGKGYWILLKKAQSYTLTGEPIPEYSLLEIDKGWHMIGGCTCSAEASISTGKIIVIYEYVQDLGYRRVRASERLVPGTGYWICLSDVADLCVEEIIPTQPDLDPIPSYTNQEVVEITGTADPLVTIKISHRTGSTQKRVDETGQFSIEIPLELNAINQFCLIATDKYGCESERTYFDIVHDNIPPSTPEFWRITLTAPNDEENVTLIGSEASTDPGAIVNITNVSTGAGTSVTSLSDGSFSGIIPASIGDTIAITSADNANNMTDAINKNVPKITPPLFRRDSGFIHGTVFNAETDEPLVEATVAIQDIDGAVFPDEEGKFMIPTPGGGTFDVTVEKEDFTLMQRRVDVVKTRNAAIEPAYLTPLDSKSTVVTQAGGTVTDSKEIIELEIPPGAVEQDTNVRVTPIGELKDIPGIQEDYNLFVFCGKFEPEDLILNELATIRIENELGFDPGTLLPLTRWNQETLAWDDVGTGVVTQDGRSIEFSIAHFSYYHCNGYIVGTGPTGGTGTSNNVGNNCSNSQGVSNTHFSMPGMKAMGSSSGVSFSYNSGLADPKVLINSHEDPAAFRGSKTRWVLNIEGVRKEATFLNPYGKTYQAYLWDIKNGKGEEVQTGSYPYAIEIADILSGWMFYKGWIYVSRPREFKKTWRDRVIVYNEKGSPFGAGWTLDGLQKLHFDEDGYILLTMGNGRALVFSPKDNSTFTPPKGDYSTLLKNDDDTYTRTLNDKTKVYFNAQGLQTAIVDRNNNTTTYDYDAQGRLISMVDPVGQETRFAYDEKGHLTSITDPIGRTSEFEIDERGDLIRITSPNGEHRTYAYDTNHLLLSEVKERGGATNYVYDSHGKLSEKIDSQGGIHRYFPKIVKGLINDLEDDVGTFENPAPAVFFDSVVSVYIDPLGNESTAKTNEFGSTIEMTNCRLCGTASKRTTFIERDENDNPIKITKPNGAVILMEYDQKGNLIVSNEDGAITHFDYDPEYNQVTKITDPKGNITEIKYDPKGNPITIIDALGNETHMSYDSKGLLIDNTDALGNMTTFTYDGRGNLLSTTDPLGNTTTFSYNNAGNVVSSTDPEGNTTQYNYDSMNRLTDVTNAKEDTTSYVYDPEGNIIQVIDANDHITSFDYDLMGQLTTSTDPLLKQKTFDYNLNGSLISSLNRNSQTITYTYDSNGQLISFCSETPFLAPKDA